MAELVTNRARKDIADGAIVLSSAGTTGINASTLKALLVSTCYLDQSNLEDQDFIATDSTDDPITYELESTSGHSRQTIGARTITENDTNNTADIDAADITFSAVSSGASTQGKAGALVIYAELSASSSESVIVSVYDTGFPVTLNGGDVTIQFSTNGILQFTT